MLNEKRSEALIELCSAMIKAYSVTGSEKEIAALIRDYMKKNGFDDAWVDDQGNVIGKICGTGGGKTVLLDGHIDTVDVADPGKWNHDPFGAEIDKDKIYGRGAADMKGALSAMITAASCFANDKRPKGDIYVTGTALEEIAEGCSLGHILESVKPDVVIIGEASELNLNIGQRGRGEIKVTTKGKSAHSSNPEVGINAVYNMIKLVDRIKQLETPTHDILGDGIMELTDIISSPYPGASVVPESCTVTFDKRLLIGDTQESIIKGINDIIDDLKREYARFEAEVTVTKTELEFYTGYKVMHSSFAPAWCLDREKSAELIDLALGALRKTGLEPEVSAYKFCTNGSMSAGVNEIPTIGFGPCAESQAHVVDEYIDISQLKMAAEGYYSLIEAICM